MHPALWSRGKCRMQAVTHRHNLLYCSVEEGLPWILPSTVGWRLGFKPLHIPHLPPTKCLSSLTDKGGVDCTVVKILESRFLTPQGPLSSHCAGKLTQLRLMDQLSYTWGPPHRVLLFKWMAHNVQKRSRHPSLSCCSWALWTWWYNEYHKCDKIMYESVWYDIYTCR